MALVHGLTVDNVKINLSEEDFAKHPRSALAGHQLSCGVTRNLFRNQPGAEDGPPAISLHSCSTMLIVDCVVPPKTPAAVRVTVAATNNICIDSLGLESADEVFVVGEVADEASIQMK